MKFRILPLFIMVIICHKSVQMRSVGMVILLCVRIFQSLTDILGMLLSLSLYECRSCFGHGTWRRK